MTNDHSNGWEGIANNLITHQRTIGIKVINKWAKALPAGGAVVDIGAGTGDPVTTTLHKHGLSVSAIEPAPTLAAEYQRRFPNAPLAIEPAEHSTYFNKTFDGAIAIGVMFLLSENAQHEVIKRVSKALKPNGQFLFSAPHQVCTWQDNWTGQESRSLGTTEYTSVLTQSGLTISETRTDEGENHYILAQKSVLE